MRIFAIYEFIILKTFKDNKNITIEQYWMMPKPELGRTDIGTYTPL